VYTLLGEGGAEGVILGGEEVAVAEHNIHCHRGPWEIASRWTSEGLDFFLSLLFVLQ